MEFRRFWPAASRSSGKSGLETLDGAGYDFRVISEERRAVEPFDLAQARKLLPALLTVKGTAEDPSYLDLVAERRPPG